MSSSVRIMVGIVFCMKGLDDWCVMEGIVSEFGVEDWNREV